MSLRAGQDFAWRRAEPYGSEAAGEGQGWYAVVVRNHLLATQRVAHRRVLLYLPAKALVVLDDVDSEDEHDYARHFHFGPGLKAESTAEGAITLTGNGIAATLNDATRNRRGRPRARSRGAPLGLGISG